MDKGVQVGGGQKEQEEQLGGAGGQACGQDREQGGGQSEPLGGVQRTAQTPSRRKSEHQVEGKRSRIDLICFIISLNFCLLSVVTYVNTKEQIYIVSQ